MTYGAVRLRLSKLLAGIDSELIDGWIQDAYTHILSKIEWKRQEFQQTFQAPASYQTGTVIMIQGSNAVVGVGTTFTAAMQGFMFRANNDDMYYQFAQLSATTATLDRPYEGPSGTYTYRIDQNLFVMSPLARIVRGVKPVYEGRDLKLIMPSELDTLSKTRNNYGTPAWYCPTWDNFSDPPCMQIELYPVPNCPDAAGRLLGFSVDLILDKTELDPDQTQQTLLPWVHPEAMIERVQSSADRFRASANPQAAGAYLQAADAHLSASEGAILVMAQVNARQRGPSKIVMDDKYRRPFRPSSKMNHRFEE